MKFEFKTFCEKKSFQSNFKLMQHFLRVLMIEIIFTLIEVSILTFFGDNHQDGSGGLLELLVNHKEIFSVIFLVSILPQVYFFICVLSFYINCKYEPAIAVRMNDLPDDLNQPPRGDDADKNEPSNDDDIKQPSNDDDTKQPSIDDHTSEPPKDPEHPPTDEPQSPAADPTLSSSDEESSPTKEQTSQEQTWTVAVVHKFEPRALLTSIDELSS